jgi:hypothetical protein
MDMQTKKVAFYLVIQLIIKDFRHKVFYLQNIYHQFVNIFNLNHVILVKSKCIPKTKDKIYQKKDVLVSSYINGQILLSVLLFKQDYTKMLKLIKKEYKDMEINFIIQRFMLKLVGK